jgi:hypothetical protein
MARILGVDADPNMAYLALLDDGRLLATPDRLRWPEGEESERLGSLFEDSRALLREHAIGRVVILLPQRTGRPGAGYYGVMHRIAMETIIRLASVNLEIPVLQIERAKVRSRLGCAREGVLEDYLDHVIPVSVGKYWKAGRGLAAMAALAAGEN